LEAGKNMAIYKIGMAIFAFRDYVKEDCTEFRTKSKKEIVERYEKRRFKEAEEKLN